MPRRLKILFWLPTVIWMSVIFAFSDRPAVQASAIDWQDFAVKKTAHFVEYSILTFLLTYSLLKTSRLQLSQAVQTAIVIAVLYAISDETHQAFIPGRGPAVRDVIIDTFGSLTTGFFLYNNPKLDNLRL